MTYKFGKRGGRGGGTEREGERDREMTKNEIERERAIERDTYIYSCMYIHG